MDATDGGHSFKPRGGVQGSEGAAAAQLPTVGSDAAGSALAVLQQSFSLLQSVVHAHGGVIKELSVDDKGTVRCRRCTFLV